MKRGKQTGSPAGISDKVKLAVIVSVFAVIGGALIFRSYASNPNLPGDINNDNIVNIADLSILLSNWGKTSTAPPPPPTNPPNPPNPQPGGPVLYVSTSGNDSNSGTSATTPKKTINAALSAASPGHTILVGPGTYNGNFMTSKGGTAGNFITIRSQVKHGAKIYGNNDTGEQAAVEINHEYIRFQDFEVTGEPDTRHGVYANANNIQIVGNHIHTICQFKTGNTGWKGGAGIQTGKAQMSNMLFDGNIIHHIGAPGSTEQLVHGMYIDAHVTNTVVSNNVIYKVEDFGLHPYDQTEASGWVFVNNTIANTGRGILQAPNGVTRNNIVYNTRGARYDIRGSGNVLSNNIAGGTGSGTGTGVTSADPMFVNAAADDYRIKPGSPAIDKGTATNAPPIDILGIKRPLGAAIDIGAYELQ